MFQEEHHLSILQVMLKDEAPCYFTDIFKENGQNDSNAFKYLDNFS